MTLVCYNLNTWNMPVLRQTKHFRRLWRSVHFSGWYNGFHVRNTWGYSEVRHSVLTYFCIAVVISDTKQSNVLRLYCLREFTSKIKGIQTRLNMHLFLSGKNLNQGGNTKESEQHTGCLALHLPQEMYRCYHIHSLWKKQKY